VVALTSAASDQVINVGRATEAATNKVLMNRL
jgi:hypothetical protein